MIYFHFHCQDNAFLKECLDSVGPFWSASDQARVGLAEDMQVLFYRYFFTLEMQVLFLQVLFHFRDAGTFSLWLQF